MPQGAAIKAVRAAQTHASLLSRCTDLDPTSLPFVFLDVCDLSVTVSVDGAWTDEDMSLSCLRVMRWERCSKDLEWCEEEVMRVYWG